MMGFTYRNPMATLQFQVVNTRKQVSEPMDGLVLLEPDRWLDHGVRCTFRVFIVRQGKLEPIGAWKIVDTRRADAPRTELPPRFKDLPAHYVSLGQSFSSYQRVCRMPADEAIALLRGLRDLTYQQVPIAKNAPWFDLTLGRFAEARSAFERGRELLVHYGLIAPTTATARPSVLDLHIRASLRGYPSPHELDISFAREHDNAGIGRVVIIVGPNGSGKTQLMAALARSLTGLIAAEIDPVSVTPKKPFSQVIAVSYGAFDHFWQPRRPGAPISYVYCGLRVRLENSEDSAITLDVDAAIKSAVTTMLTLDVERRNPWRKALETVNLEALFEAASNGRAAALAHMKDHLSAGQKLVALAITNLAARLHPDTIVLYDEPETHLHPNLLTSLLRAIHGLVAHFDSYAILATHSIIPVQETLSRHVVIFDRYIDGVVRALPPAEQCFAATLDEITRMVFRTRPEDQNFRTVLSELRSGRSPEDIRQLLGGELSLGARLLLARWMR
jgi:ABC-type cobalamin/Fe3+-siderophores transport system ATPase subunit